MSPAPAFIVVIPLLLNLTSARPEPESPSSLLLRSLAWLRLPGLSLLLPARPQQRTLAPLSSLPMLRLLPSLSRTKNRDKRVRNNNRLPKSRRRPHKLPYTAANTIRDFETFTLEDHIRAKPDVIHYVDSPKIYEKENTGAVSSKEEEKSSLYWHKDASNKFIVKRQPGPFKLQSSSSSSTSTTETPMVKIVRYDPESQEDIRGKIASDSGRVDGVIMSTITSTHDSKQQSDQRFLPVQVGNTRFPLPDSAALTGKTVKSVVLVLPQTLKLR